MSLINKEDLIAEYDRVHLGQPGGLYVRRRVWN